LAVVHLGDDRLFILQNAASTYGDYVDFLTTYLSLVHVITPDDLVGTKINWINIIKEHMQKAMRLSDYHYPY